MTHTACARPLAVRYTLPSCPHRVTVAATKLAEIRVVKRWPVAERRHDAVVVQEIAWRDRHGVIVAAAHDGDWTDAARAFDDS